MPADSHPRDAAGRDAAGREIELKLQVSPDDLARIADDPALAALREGAQEVRHQHTVYYDTPDLRLAGRGVAVRVRRIGDRFIQTVKTMGSGEAGDAAAVAVRREWEWAVADADPHLGLLGTDGLDQIIPADALPALVPIFSTGIRRTAMVLRPDALTTIEAAFDLGEVRAGDACQPICEIELELLAGRVGRLFDLALDLQRLAPLRITTRSKADIGYTLVTGRAAQPALPAPLGLLPTTTVAEAFRHIVRHCLRQLLGNEDCALAELRGERAPAEGLHQMRLAVRRLRTALSQFRDVITSPEAGMLRTELRWLADEMAPAREWDVLRAGFLAPFTDRYPATAGLTGLTAAATAAHRAAAAEAVAAIEAPRYTGLLLSLASWLEEGRWHAGADPALRALLDRPVTDRAGPWLTRRHAKTRKPGKSPDKLDAAARDRLRLRIKKLRYATEFFRGLYPPPLTRPYLAALEALQTPLDDLNDATTARARLAGLGRTGDDAMCRAADTVLTWLDRHTAKLPAALPERWRVFKAVPTFWG